MPNPYPRLNTNIETLALSLATVVMIMEYLDSSDLLAVMHTCHMLYTAGIQLLVRTEHYLFIDTIPSYRAFMISNAPASFNAVQELIIDYWTNEDEPPAPPIDVLPAPLCDVLSRGNTQLRRLYLMCDEMPDDVAQAVASLEHLHKLEVYNDVDTPLIYILSNLKSPLRELSTRFKGDEYEGPIISLFAKVRDTLETLTLQCSTLDSAGICFSKLTSLHLGAYPVPLSVLISTFPNLQELEFSWYSGNKQSLRSQNIAFQQAGHTWTSLRRLKADIRHLSYLALLQDLDDLTIPCNFQQLSPQELYALQSILSETRPKSLKVSWDVEAETLQAIILSAGLERIVDLSLNLAFNNVRHMEDVLVRLSGPLANLTSEC